VTKKLILFCLLSFSLALFSPGTAQSQGQPAKPAVAKPGPVAAATEAMVDFLTRNFHVKKVVGDPIKVGAVTIIPVMMVDIGYGGGGGGGSAEMFPVGSGFFLSGELKPLGFIVITKSGTKFLVAGQAPRD
jgi:uncharacterized spore protein YtfJ